MRRRQFIQRTILIFSFLKINPTIVFPKASFEIADFEENWKNYIKNPCNQTAIAAYKTIPIYKTYDEQKKSRIFNLVNDSIDKLEKHLSTGNKNALELAFKLFSITDGELCEFLTIIIGAYIHINPTFFLETLENHYHLIPIPSLLGNYGLDFVDEFELQNIETQKRIDSLNLVDVPDLKKLKNECITHLQKQFISQDIIEQIR
jgi:hypothetical protein